TEPRDPEPENDVSEAVDVVAVLLIVFFYFIQFVLLPFAFSAVTAFVLTPLVDWLAKTIRAPRVAVGVTVFFAFLGLFGFAAYLVIPGLLHEGLFAVSHLQEIIEQPLKNLLGNGQVQILGPSVSASDIAAAAVAKLRSLLQGGALTTLAL